MASTTNNPDASICEKALTRCTVPPSKCVERDREDLIVSSTLSSLTVRSLNYSNIAHTSAPIQKLTSVTLVPTGNEQYNGIKIAHRKQLQNVIHILKGYNNSSDQNQPTKVQTEAEDISKIKLENSQISNSVGKLNFLTFSSANANLLPLLIPISLVVGKIYEMVIVTVPYAKTESVLDISTFIQSKVNKSIRWAQDQRLYSKLSPLLCGIAVAIFSFMLVYLDSDIPGVSPPSPFSPLKHTYRRERRSALHLGYIIALASGAMVTLLMYCDFSGLEI
ncbi:uncharacterized protein [Eurosta solidaginis]|uniref:uncharacterized protein n=1 Tax=Eurosta solidaginis TaxID=178769 RepID=UPI0035309B44